MNRKNFLKSVFLSSFSLGDPSFLGFINRRPSTFIPFSFSENFETPTTGYENTWVAGGTGTINPATSTTGLSLQASQCIQITASAQNPITYSTLSTSLPEIYIYFLLRVHTAAAANQIILDLTNSSGTQILSLYFMSTGRLALYDSSSTASPADSLSLDTTYSVWLYYKSGTGSNGLLECEFATTPTKVGSGTKFASTSNGINTQNFARIRLGNISNFTCDYYFDMIRIKNSVIGSNPT